MFGVPYSLLLRTRGSILNQRGHTMFFKKK